ncbi:DUF4362 domain-containing protein [Paenibacillus antarcticus]|uniref:DUF4362 domain-containing protein n=1 Tax=Paenibacillus antarcticus TaxID=253703 RepID=A0A168PY96_9BACL|nr:DUF4362 domain-containing protein [Paenibacillus antarcticus]OAB47184.1 hypothetical protein PBAT_07865 [Paenibacillus antarcticus]
MKKTIWLLSIIIVVLCICLFYFIRLNAQYDKKYIQRGILTNFNKLEYERMHIFYERFQDHKGDNVMLISPTSDSGPIIYDVNFNGSEIRFTTDATRDAYSGQREKITYFCKEMNKEEGIHNNIFTVSNCKGFESEDVKGYLQFSKEMNIFK